MLVRATRAIALRAKGYSEDASQNFAATISSHTICPSEAFPLYNCETSCMNESMGAPLPPAYFSAYVKICLAQSAHGAPESTTPSRMASFQELPESAIAESSICSAMVQPHSTSPTSWLTWFATLRAFWATRAKGGNISSRAAGRCVHSQPTSTICRMTGLRQILALSRWPALSASSVSQVMHPASTAFVHPTVWPHPKLT